MKKITLMCVIVVCTVVVYWMIGRAIQNRKIEQSLAKSQQETIDIPRTHWGITLGQSRAEVDKYLKRMGSPKIEKSKYYAITWDEIKLRKTHTEYPEGEVVDYELEGSNEYYSISIEWFKDKVVSILVNPYNSETIAEGVRLKYPLQQFGRDGDTVTEFVYYMYENESTRLIMAEMKDWVDVNFGYRLGDIRTSRRAEPRCSYDFIYRDLNLWRQKQNYEDSVKRAADQRQKAKAIEKATNY